MLFFEKAFIFTWFEYTKLRLYKIYAGIGFQVRMKCIFNNNSTSASKAY